MLFDTFEFLIFFIVVTACYYLLPGNWRWGFLLVTSYYFYMAWKPELALLLLTSTVTDYYCGIYLYLVQKKHYRQLLLALSLIINLGLLFFFKYSAFFSKNLVSFLALLGFQPINGTTPLAEDPFAGVLLPVGISFYTLQTLGYTIDIYRKKLIPEQNFVRYALYVSFFPQLVAGPIERAGRFLPQLQHHKLFNLQAIREGIILMAWGYFLKVVCADRLGIYVDEVYANPGEHSGLPLALGVYFFAFQIYFDFAAYSIIAIGAAKVLGFDLMSNFERPIFAATAADFWRRWHISFMSWLRDYLYRPMVRWLGWNRGLAIVGVFTISGLWHGASWSFVVWGLLSGVFLLIETRTSDLRSHLRQRYLPWISPRVAMFSVWLVGFNAFCLFGVFFRATSLEHALIYLASIPRITDLHINILHDRLELVLSFLVIFVVQIVHFFCSDQDIPHWVSAQSTWKRWTLYFTFLGVIILFGVNRQDPFIYFQF